MPTNTTGEKFKESSLIMNNWSKRRKGTAIIYTHPTLTRAIVHNFKGIWFNGVEHKDIQSAKEYALKERNMN